MSHCSGRMQRLALLAVCSTCLLAFSDGSAASKAKAPVKVSEIKLKFFSQEDASLHDFDKPPNIYGADMEILVLVKVEGKLRPGDKSRLVLKLTAPAWSDEASGSHPPWKTSRKRVFQTLSEKGASWFVFVLPYKDCYSKVKLSVSASGKWGKSSRTRTISLACAE